MQRSGTAEMIRHVKVARDTAVKARTQAMHTLKSLIVTAPLGLRERLDALCRQDDLASVRRGAATRPSCLDHGFGQDRPTRTRPTLAGPG